MCLRPCPPHRPKEQGQLAGSCPSKGPTRLVKTPVRLANEKRTAETGQLALDKLHVFQKPRGEGKQMGKGSRVRWEQEGHTDGVAEPQRPEGRNLCVRWHVMPPFCQQGDRVRDREQRGEGRVKLRSGTQAWQPNTKTRLFSPPGWPGAPGMSGRLSDPRGQRGPQSCRVHTICQSSVPRWHPGSWGCYHLATWPAWPQSPTQPPLCSHAQPLTTRGGGNSIQG